MAVEARYFNLFSPQHLINRQMMNPIEENLNLYNTQMGFGVPFLSGTPTTTATATETESLFHSYGSFITDSVPQKQTVINNNLLLSRKRTREEFISPFSFLGHDISFHIQQQQFHIDRLISQHMGKVRIEIEDRRKKQARKIMEVVEGTIIHKLRTKEEEIEKIKGLNWALEEKVKSLCMENQILRHLAQSNEATANALRTNLQQILANNNEVNQNGVGLDFMDDAQSCCGSSYDYEDDVVKNEEEQGLCRNCKKDECSVLFLPCRHLCLCSVCGSSLHTCPICKSSKNASVHVNMSS